MFLAGMLVLMAAAPAADWKAEIDNGKRAFARQEYAEALARTQACEEAARAAEQPGAVVDCRRLAAAIHRERGNAAEAERGLHAAAEQAQKVYGESAPENAGVFEELATLHRAQGRAEAAMAAVEKAIKIREAPGGSSRVANQVQCALRGHWPKTMTTRRAPGRSLTRSESGQPRFAIRPRGEGWTPRPATEAGPGSDMPAARACGARWSRRRRPPTEARGPQIKSKAQHIDAGRTRDDPWRPEAVTIPGLTATSGHGKGPRHRCRGFCFQ
jgi:hypothetical protein